MAEVQCLVSSALSSGLGFNNSFPGVEQKRLPNGTLGDSYRLFPVPTLDMLLNDVPADSWPVVEIPECYLDVYDEDDKYSRSRIDGDFVDFERFRYFLGDTVGLVTADSDDVFKIRYADGAVGDISCHDLFSCMTAYQEALMVYANKSDFASIFKSCAEDYQDESPYLRTVRVARNEFSPIDSPESYQMKRMANSLDYSKLPSSSGFVRLNHTIVRKDMISDDMQKINGVMCRRIEVPSVKNFVYKRPDDKSLYDEVYVPIDNLWDVHSNFLQSDVHSNPDPDSKVKEYSKKAKQVMGLSDGYYVGCTISDTGCFYNADGSVSKISVRDFSARMTCLTSCQTCRDNLLFDLDRFHSLYNMAADSPVGGAFLNRMEMEYNIPAVDFEKGPYNTLHVPSADKVRDVRAKMDKYCAESMVKSSLEATRTRSSHSAHSPVLDSHVHRDHFKSLFSAMIAKHTTHISAVSDDAEAVIAEAGSQPDEQEDFGKAPVADVSEQEQEFAKAGTGSSVVPVSSESALPLEEVPSPKEAPLPPEEAPPLEEVPPLPEEAPLPEAVPLPPEEVVEEEIPEDYINGSRERVLIYGDDDIPAPPPCEPPPDARTMDDIYNALNEMHYDDGFGDDGFGF